MCACGVLFYFYYFFYIVFHCETLRHSHAEVLVYRFKPAVLDQGRI